MQINSTTNDTGKLFNWHPFLMALAFPLLMGEALLSYRVPLAPNLIV
jgi:cytochrome b-561